MGRRVLRRKILISELGSASLRPVLVITCLLFILPFMVYADPAVASQTDINTSGRQAIERPLRSQITQNSPLPEAGHSYPKNLSIPGVEKELTQYYIRQYTSGGGLSWLKAVIERGEPYLCFIREEIRRRNLPEELVFIPVIESTFVATAVSKSGAAGLWQFMTNSIAPFDMSVNDWMDERLDFWKSTTGALRKLEENYNYLGDWPLALAAYNAGLGAVSRASAGNRNYWSLCEQGKLKTETIHYVPKILAVAHVLSNQRRYGIDISWPKDHHWTRIPVDRSVDIELLAAAAGIDKKLLVQANQELRYGVTPPDKNYMLKVSSADAEQITVALREQGTALIRHYLHTVRSGDTLSALARHYGISVGQILEANPGTEARFLRLGSTLIIPALRESGPYTGQHHQDRIPVFEGNHLVKKGETLWSIALAYNVNPETLAEANGMQLNDILREGRSLKTPIIETR